MYTNQQLLLLLLRVLLSVPVLAPSLYVLSPQDFVKKKGVLNKLRS